MKLKIKKVGDVPTPKYGREGDAALDLHAVLDGPLTLAPGGRAEFGTGLAMEIPAGYVGLMFPRGGMGRKGLSLANTVGVIDSNYRGELMVNAVNTGVAPITIEPGDRVMQLVITPAMQCAVEIVEELEESSRGEGRYGSSGR